MRMQDRGIRPTKQHAGEHPGQVHRIGNARVHAIAGKRHPDMRRIATQEHAPVAELVGDQAAAVPIFLADDLVFEFRPDPDHQAETPVPIDRFEVRFVRAQIAVQQPGLPPINGKDVGAAPGVDRLVRPRRPCLHHPQQ